MATIYNGKHCVFEEVGVDTYAGIWNQNTNVDNDNAYNDWNISYMRTTSLPARLLLLSSALQDNLSNTTIQTATNGNNGTLVNTSDKLFLAAEKEMTGTRSKSVQQEFDALTTWSYWITHTTTTDRKKYDQNNTAKGYWLRSPNSGAANSVVVVYSSGVILNDVAHITSQVSLCYAF